MSDTDLFTGWRLTHNKKKMDSSKKMSQISNIYTGLLFFQGPFRGPFFCSACLYVWWLCDITSHYWPIRGVAEDKGNIAVALLFQKEVRRAHISARYCRSPVQTLLFPFGCAIRISLSSLLFRIFLPMNFRPTFRGEERPARSIDTAEGETVLLSHSHRPCSAPMSATTF